MKKERAISISLTNGAECICDPDIVLGDKYGLWDINNEVSPRGTLLDLNTAWELFISKQGLSGYTFEQQEDSEHGRTTYILVDKDKNPVGPEFTVETDNGAILVPITETITSLTAEKGKYYRLDAPVETLAITLPAMDAVESVKEIGIYFTAGTTPAVTITSADSKDVYYQDGYEIEAGKTYKVNALFDGGAWVVTAIEIFIPEPMNIITYEAPAKLTETTSDYTGGLHKNAFSGTSGKLTMTSHTFENGVGTIEFNGDVTSIGHHAFYNCSGLTSITIPDSVTSIGQAAFYGCSGLTSITIPNSVTSIGDSAFSGCRGFTSITIPNRVTSISSGAFQRCSGLTSVTIPNSVTSIGQNPFEDCPLTSIVVDSANTVYDSRNNCNAIIKTSTNVLITGCKNTIIPNTVTSIGNLAFYNCSGLTSIDIPNSVTSISNSAFGMCSDLTSVTIGSGVTSIGQAAFTVCSGLTSVTIGSSVTSIGNQAFYNCSGLTSITSNAIKAPSIQSSTFEKVKTRGTLTVPNGSSGYNVWMGTGNYYLGKYNWTKVEQ